MKHSHYKKDVSHLQYIDVYRVCQLFDVTDAAISHAVKKLLCAGQRGVKTTQQDVQEAIDTLNRYQAMQAEDEALPAPAQPAYLYLKEVADYMKARAALRKSQEDGGCYCEKCDAKRFADARQPFFRVRMYLCPKCSNKRCPKAHDHKFKCSGSNDVGQVGAVEDGDWIEWLGGKCPVVGGFVDVKMRSGAVRNVLAEAISWDMNPYFPMSNIVAYRTGEAV